MTDFKKTTDQTQTISLQIGPFLTRPRRGMKPLPTLILEVQLLKQRAVIESVNDILTSICDLEHTRHRSPFNAFANAYAALIAYQFLDYNPMFLFLIHLIISWLLNKQLIMKHLNP